MDPNPEGYCSLEQLAAIHEGMGLGVLILDERQRLIRVSPLAKRLLESKGIPWSNASRRDLHDVLRQSWIRSGGKPARFVLRRPGRIGSLFVYVARVELRETGHGQADQHYLVLVRDPISILSGEHKALGEVFGLTRRESELACYLAMGADLARFASDKFVSVYTAKSHLKQIFRKMGVHRQSELVVNVLAVLL